MVTQPEIVIVTVLRDERGKTGVQTQFSVLRDYLEAIGHPVNVITPFSYSRAIVYPVFAFRKLLGSLENPRSLWWYRTWHYRFVRAALKRHLATRPNAIIYAQDVLATRAALATRADGQPVIRAMHNTLSEADEWVEHETLSPGSPQYETIRQQEKDSLSQADRLIFASEVQQSDMAKIFPSVATTPSIVLPEFIDEPSTDGRRASRDAITIGSLDRRKNHRFLISAIAAAKAAGHRFTLSIVGEGPERKALEQQIRELNVEDEVMLTGQVASEDIGSVLSDHRIYLHASRQESFGLAIVEAMAVGVPVIVGDIGGVADYLEDGRDARFWANLDDAKEAANLLIECLGDDQILAEQAQAGLDRFRGTLSVDAVAPRLLDYLLNA